jgi:prepilin-type N-terminal cleavage/methylation domain-containing protein
MQNSKRLQNRHSSSPGKVEALDFRRNSAKLVIANGPTQCQTRFKPHNNWHESCFIVEISLRKVTSLARAFTLIELLIVVAIIAILAAIAVPNLLQAETRSKVSRELADMRTVATGLEAYAVDQNAYPPHGEILADGTINFPAVLAGIGTVEYLPGAPLTTPLAYLSGAPNDILYRATDQQPLKLRFGYLQTKQMQTIMHDRGWLDDIPKLEGRYGGWRLYAAGPDGDKGPDTKTSILYDPTNGVVSDGDIVRSQLSPIESLAEDEH